MAYVLTPKETWRQLSVIFGASTADSTPLLLGFVQLRIDDHDHLAT